MTEADESVPIKEQRTFSDLGLSETLLQRVTDMGFQRPTPVQAASYGPVSEGRDVIVQSETGSGKTAAFGLPLVDRVVQATEHVQALAVAPTRELAAQVAKQLNELGEAKDLKCIPIYGGTPMDAQLEALQGKPQLVAGTPGRILDHLRRGTLDVSHLRVFVLDEADEMLSMGFAEELNAIKGFLPSEKQTLLFSATVDGSVKRLAQNLTRDPLLLRLSDPNAEASPSSIDHYIYRVSGHAKTQDLQRILALEQPSTAMVFCNTKEETERVQRDLSQQGLECEFLNGDLPQRKRDAVIKRVRDGNLKLLVCTDVAARGIDIPHLTHVVNFAFPSTAEHYIHRTGRTGRQGKHGTAISLVTPAEVALVYYLRLETKIQPVERSLPSKHDELAREQLDTIRQVEERISITPSSTWVSIAQRVLTLSEPDQFVARLLQTIGEQRSARDAPQRKSTPQEHTPETISRLSLGLGRNEGLRPGEVVRFLTTSASLTPEDIGKIKIYDSETTVEIPDSHLEGVLAALDGSELRGVEVHAQRAGESS